MDSPRWRVDHDTVIHSKHDKKEVELKVRKVLELIKSDDDHGKFLEDSSRRSEIVRLIEEIHSQYQILCGQGVTRLTTRSRRANGSASASDSEYYSSEDNNNAVRKATFKEVLTMDRRQQVPTTKEEQNQTGEKLEPPVSLNVNGSAVPTQTTAEIEGQLEAMRTEVESLRGRNQDLKMQFERKVIECKKLGVASLQWKSKLSELESEAKIKNEISMSQTKKLMEENSKLQAEVELLRDQRGNFEFVEENEAAAHVKGLEERVHAVEEEIATILCQKTELELKIETQSKEASAQQVKIDVLQEEIMGKNVYIDVCKNEKEALHQRANELQQEVQSLEGLTCELEKSLKDKDKEIETLANEREMLCMKNEKLKLQVQTLCHQNKELENRVTEIVSDADLRVKMDKLIEMSEKLELEVDSLFDENTKMEESSTSTKDEDGTLKVDDKKYDNDTLGTSATVLESRVQKLQQEMDSLYVEKRTMEVKTKTMKMEFEQKQIELEREIQNLNQKLLDQKKLMQEREVSLKKPENLPLVKHLSLDSPKARLSDSPRRGSDSPRYNQQSLERKIEELADRFHMKMENHLRLLYQRILVAEHIHSETKDSYKTIKETLRQENEQLNEKMTAFEDALRTFKGLLSDSENFTPVEVGGVTSQGRKNADSLNRIGKIISEIQSAKDLVAAKNNEINALKQKVAALKLAIEENGKQKLVPMQQQRLDVSPPEQSEACGHGEKLSKLELRVDYLEQKLEQREEVLLSLVEEKREAIKQLCILIDYHQSRCSDMQMAMSNITTKTRNH